MMGHKAAKVPFALLSQISVTLRKSKHSSASVKKQHRFNQPKICSQLKTRKKIIIICSSYLLCKHILNLLTLAVPWPRYAFISYAALFCFCRTLPNFISIKNLDNKSSSQRSKTLLFHFESFPLCEHAFFKKGFSFFFCKWWISCFQRRAHSFPPPVIRLSQEQTLICAFQQSGPLLSIHL